jgi:hypothetical protein
MLDLCDQWIAITSSGATPTKPIKIEGADNGETMIVSIAMTAKEREAFAKAIASGKLTEYGMPPTTQIVSPDQTIDVKDRWTAWEAKRAAADQDPKPGRTKE